MMQPPVTIDFSIEHMPENLHAPWLAAFDVEGTVAIGCGATPWAAIGDALTRGFKAALEFGVVMRSALRDNVEGRCPRCKAPREPMPDPLPPTGWPMMCDACRGEL